MKFILLLALLAQPCLYVFAQECKVLHDSLRGSYSGGCKKGKAHGKGKSTGSDSYEGEFRSGFPEGKGTYTWKNGDKYSGEFAQGLRNGEGTMIYRRSKGPDSVVKGFWRKGKYVGKNEKPYRVYFTSKMITELDVEHKKDGFNIVTIYVTNTSGGGITLSEGELPKLKVDDVQLLEGSFSGTLTHNLNHVKKTESIIRGLLYPVRLKLVIGSEEIDIEFFEVGSYELKLKINQ